MFVDVDISLPELCLIAFVVQFLHVAFAAFQNINVVLGRPWYVIIPTSYGLTYSKGLEQTVIIVNISLHGVNEGILILLFVMGTAGWMASFAAMRFDKWIS